MNVFIDAPAQEAIAQYYEDYESNYQYGYQQTDLRQRADNYQNIINTLRGIGHYIDRTINDNGKNYIQGNRIKIW